MTVSVFFNILITLMVSILSFWVARLAFNKTASKNPFRLFGFFWFFTGGVWAFAGIRLLSAYFGYLGVDKTLFISGQFFVLFSVVAAGAYVAWRISLKEKLIPVFVVLLGLVACVAAFFLLYEGVAGPHIDTWGTKYTPGDTTSVIVFIIISTTIVGAICFMGATFLGFVRGKSVDWVSFLLMFSIVLYGIGGALDEFGVSTGWKLMLVRTTLLVAAMIAYIGLLNLEKQNTHSVLKTHDNK